MIELAMVRRMVLRGLLFGPAVIGGLWVFGSGRWALSGAVGLALALANLWLSARVIGGIAENNPELLLAGGMVAFMLGLALMTGIAFALRAAELVYFPVTGFVLIGAHLLLVLWEAAGAYAVADPLAKRALPSRQHADLRS